MGVRSRVHTLELERNLSASKPSREGRQLLDFPLLQFSLSCRLRQRYIYSHLKQSVSGARLLFKVFNLKTKSKALIFKKGAGTPSPHQGRWTAAAWRPGGQPGLLLQRRTCRKGTKTLPPGSHSLFSSGI